MALAIDVTSSQDVALLNNGQTITTNAFTTASGNQVLVALVSSSAGRTNTDATVSTSVTGAGLTWALVKRQAINGGCSEVWSAFSSGVLTAQTVSALLTDGNFSAGGTSITVLSFTGADTTGTNGSGAMGATSGASTASGTLSANVTTTRNNSWVFGVGHDWTTATAITMGGSQTLIHEFVNGTNNDDIWSQRQTSTTPTSGTVVTINMTAPTAIAGDLAVVEILPAAAGATTPQIMAAMDTPTNTPVWDRIGLVSYRKRIRRLIFAPLAIPAIG